MHEILIVDDTFINLQILSNLLSKNGYEVALAEDGRQALSYVAGHSPDIILLDVMMPTMDGFEVCRRLKAEKKSRHIPVLFITALTEKDEKLRGFKVGGEDYITKPFLVEEVLARVNAVSQRLAIKEELRASYQKLQEANEGLEQKVFARTSELRSLQSQLVMQEKMASIGQLAEGLAHELHNPINFVFTNFSTLANNFQDLQEMVQAYRAAMAKLPGPVRQAITAQEEFLEIDFLLEDIPVIFTESRTGLKRVVSIIESMRNFGQVSHSGDYRLFNINKGIEDTLVIARNTYKHHAVIEKQLAKLPQIPCLPDQLNQVFLNLIVNAAQSISPETGKKGGLIVIRTWEEAQFVCCEISDNGSGIEPDHLDRIFEPFFSTKEPGKGTGLGLSISYDIIVHKHDGQLTAHCPKAGGTVFTLRIPKDLGKAEVGQEIPVDD
ncbi:MAG: response regulator [Thermodesulfobacteriota bacterium]